MPIHLIKLQHWENEKTMEIEPTKIIKIIIEKVVASKSDYKNISPIVTEEVLTAWEKTLAKYSRPENCIIESKFNLLTTLFIARHGKEYKTEFEPYKQTIKLLDSLNAYLTVFPDLLCDDSFKAKITNLGGYNFLSTLSELSLSNFLKGHDFEIIFEAKYRKKNKKDEKDIDLKIVDKNNNVFFFEIYTPNDQAEINGFFPPQEFSDKLKNKLIFKAQDKFTEIDSHALSGKRFLAANTLFSDIFSMNIRFFNCENYFNQLIRIMPEELDGVLLFEDNFNNTNSLRIVKMLLKE